MKTRLILLLAAGAMLAIMQGCQQRIEAYQSMTNYSQAQNSAGLVVFGDVTDVHAVTHYRGDEISSAGIGVLGTECVAEEQVSINVEKTYKGPANQTGPMTFYYYGPCFHPSPGIKLVVPQRAVAAGDKATVYLQNRKGQWWMIAHKLPEEGSRPTGYIRQREQIY